MDEPPVFAALSDHIARLRDVGFWRPYVAEVLARHNFDPAAREPVAGFNGTYPTFVCGDVVVKLFGYSKAWREAHTGERAAYALLATDPEVAAPRLLGEGWLFDDEAAPWPYLIISRMRGDLWRRRLLEPEQRLSNAAELGRQVGRIQALPVMSLATLEQLPTPDIAAAAAQSSLPSHLVAQVGGFLAGPRPVDPVFVHGDLVPMHVFLADGRLAGIIDWGDAVAADRHYELAQVHLNLFDGDKMLLRAFLEASEWPMTEDFAHRALAMALRRQAHGLATHHSMDVFYRLPMRLPLEAVESLEDLATILFAV